jgi:hypothetical protein
MLVARRDPPLHAEAHDSAPPLLGVHPDLRPPRLLRFVTMMQLLGSVLAVPIGLASAYSIYRANFSPETTCQNLRTNIVSMLDKSVDAGTRHMLVRRDVEAFEQNCGAVDPDATAAFKALLAADAAPKPPAIAAAPAAPKVERSAAPMKDAERKAEPRPQQIVKHTPAIRTPIASDWGHRESGVSDAQWLDAVRHAMATHSEQQPQLEAARPRVMPVTPRPAQQAVVQPIAAPAEAAPAPVAAPVALAPPAVVATPHRDANHPVPPDAIPDPAEVAAMDSDRHHSRIRRWIAKIPLMGNVIDNGLE